MSVREALKHAALHLGVEVDILGCIQQSWRKAMAGRLFEQADGILVPGGFGSRGIEGKIQAARYARENKSTLPGIVPGDAAHGGGVCPAWSGR